MAHDSMESDTINLEHSRVMDEVVRARMAESPKAATHNPFADLKAMMKKE